ncbi:hypothetical protein GUJ93_ZPchr0001g31347 [Zizania palustris]|uniref:Jacalin-type lectin domain-containing protein n=1 Tax=Zizania palustris TaxID=103762 RepID=A0A8J5RQP3_ZIZPA|nr:hypothetical protein GUJ93_ZPchr0001g31347 [Zizania palustris]
MLGQLLGALATILIVLASQASPSPDGLAQIGMFGANTGTTRNIDVAPVVLKSVTVRSIDTIDAITFVYLDGNGKEHKVGPWGGTLGYDHTFNLTTNEYVKEVSGTYGPFPTQKLPLTVNSLIFVTSRGIRYAFGTPGASDTKFNVPLEKGSIVGFSARADNFVFAIGFYVRP